MIIVYILRCSIHFQHVKSGRGRVVSLMANFLFTIPYAYKPTFGYVMGDASSHIAGNGSLHMGTYNDEMLMSSLTNTSRPVKNTKLRLSFVYPRDA